MCIHKYAHIYTHMAGGKQTSSYLSALLCASYIQSRRSSALANHDHLNFTCSLSPSKQRSKRKISDWDQNGLAVVIIYPRSPPPVDAHFAHVCVYTYTHLWWVVNWGYCRILVIIVGYWSAPLLWYIYMQICTCVCTYTHTWQTKE